MFAAVFLLLVTPYYQSVKLWGGFGHLPLEIPIANELAPSSYQSRMRWLWGGFGEALRRLGEAFGASELILGGFGRLWGSLWEGFGRLWGALGDVGGVFGKSLGGLGEALGAFQSLFSSRAFSSSPIHKYITNSRSTALAAPY